jgi:toxin ParE1/3/4
MKLSIARSALNDLQDLKQYYLDEGVPEIGQQMVNDVLKKSQRLIDHPDSGRIVPEFNQPQIREIIHPPFRIIYLRNTSTVNLIRVWRSERVLFLPEDDV